MTTGRLDIRRATRHDVPAMSFLPLLLDRAEDIRAALPPKPRPFSADVLIAAARRATGLADFGDADFRDGLNRFLAACADEARLGMVGRAATRWDVLRFLSNLLQMARAEQSDPNIARQEISQPVFITGLPRSGTSFLHNLLMEDPANRVPRIWQLIAPYAATTEERRIAQVNSQLRTFERIAPGFRSLHPITAVSAQECSEITAHVFASLRFDTTYRIPAYRSWLDAHGHNDAYRFHKRFLQHLQHQAPAPGRWFLKCPDHVFALDAIAAIYPDANIVFVHRDPLKVLPSVAKLTEILRRPFSRHIDRADIGAQESARWLQGAAHMIAASGAQSFRRPIFHVHYRELVADPPATIAALYRHFDLDLAAETEARIRRRVAADGKGGYGANRYRFEDFSLDPAQQRALFETYTRHFDVAREVP